MKTLIIVPNHLLRKPVDTGTNPTSKDTKQRFGVFTLPNEGLVSSLYQTKVWYLYCTKQRFGTFTVS